MKHLRMSILLAALLASGVAAADDISMADGKVHFATPANWLAIMQTQGDPEVQVFQVPDPSPAGSTTLARVTVTVKQVADMAGYQAYFSQATAKAHALTGFVAATPPKGAANANDLVYTAQESGQRLAYRERYWFAPGMAIQLRCVRPAAAAAAWTTAFDAGCDNVAATMPH
jgi:hypothetical protein